MDLQTGINDYRVTSLVRTVIDDQVWYQYTISNRCATSTITGTRQGTEKQVTIHAEEYSRQLNERLHNNTGNYRSNYQKRK